MRRLLVLAGLAALVLLGVFLWFRSGWTGDGPLEREVAVVVPKGSLSKAAAVLEERGVLASADSFLTCAKLFGGGAPIKAGEFAFPAGASPAQALAILQEGKPIQRLVTIPEGTPSVLVQDALAKAAGLTGAAPLPAEGSVLPDSYSYERGESRAVVMARMQAAMTKALAELWPRRSPGTVVRSPAQAVTLASIVEKETGKPSERRTVAGVYSNRLRIGMKLDADPTVIYPVTKGRPLGRRILRSELQAKNGYNTYASPGLPVGPIANPGRASIEAVLNPAETKALYFVATGDGGHVFAATLAEHNANVAKWFALRRARGEM